MSPKGFLAPRGPSHDRRLFHVSTKMVLTVSLFREGSLEAMRSCATGILSVLNVPAWQCH